MAKPRRPKHYDRPGYRPGPEGKGSYLDQKGAEDARQQLKAELPRCKHCGAGPAGNCGAPGCEIPRQHCPYKENE